MSIAYFAYPSDKLVAARVDFSKKRRGNLIEGVFHFVPDLQPFCTLPEYNSINYISVSISRTLYNFI